jgi:hypothetical protein
MSLRASSLVYSKGVEGMDSEYQKELRALKGGDFVAIWKKSDGSKRTVKVVVAGNDYLKYVRKENVEAGIQTRIAFSSIEEFEQLPPSPQLQVQFSPRR